ncbi:hypothetical protein RAD15_09835 [Bradyrhizobium sp. 14AA]
MMIGRMILINSILALLMLVSTQAANITTAGAANLSMRGNEMQRGSDRGLGTTQSLVLAQAECSSEQWTNRVISAAFFGRPQLPEQT